MIHEIELNNFKCFGYLKCPLRPITVLTGLNGSGKSSLIQALLCTKDVAQRELRTGVTSLKPRMDCLDLGGVGDVAYRFADTDNVGCRVSSITDGDYGWAFSYSVRDKNADEIVLKKTCVGEGCVKQLASIRYLSANREGPKSISSFFEGSAQVNDVGVRGEKVSSCLAMNADVVVSSEMLTRDELTQEDHFNTLVEQTSAWLRKFTPAVFVDARKIIDGSHVELQYAFTDRKSESRYRPENVGVGLSIVLPFIVLLLTSRRGDIVIVENPESELHPKGQSEIANLIAHAAKAGVQIIVETHSDHIINGIRLAVKNGCCKAEDVGLLFFKRHTKRPYAELPTGWQVSTMENLVIDGSGVLSNSPNDFLEQWALDTDKLMDFGEIGGVGDDESNSES